ARRNAERYCRLDVFLSFYRERLAAYDARHVEPEHRADRDEHQHEIPPEEHDQQDDEEDERQRIEDIDDAHHHLVHPAAEKSRDRPVDHANDDGDQSCDQTDRQRYTPGNESPREEVTASI